MRTRENALEPETDERSRHKNICGNIWMRWRLSECIDRDRGRGVEVEKQVENLGRRCPRQCLTQTETEEAHPPHGRTGRKNPGSACWERSVSAGIVVYVGHTSVA